MRCILGKDSPKSKRELKKNTYIKIQAYINNNNISSLRGSVVHSLLPLTLKYVDIEESRIEEKVVR